VNPLLSRGFTRHRSRNFGLGKIFSGGITTWNDPAVAALNPGVTLPATKVRVIYRNDESGTDRFSDMPRSPQARL